jgi:hypothetical protein
MGIEPTTKKEDKIIEKDLQEQKPKEMTFGEYGAKPKEEYRQLLQKGNPQGLWSEKKGWKEPIKKKRVVSEETRAKLRARIPTPKQLEARKKFAELMKKKKQEKQEREGKK